MLPTYQESFGVLQPGELSAVRLHQLRLTPRTGILLLLGHPVRLNARFLTAKLFRAWNTAARTRLTEYQVSLFQVRAARQQFPSQRPQL